jgi:signal peptidase II
MFYFPILEGNYPQWFPILGGDHFIFFRPVFNVADSAITCGVISLLIFQRQFFNTPKETNEDKKEDIQEDSSSEPSDNILAADK